ncbi:SNF2 family N-terminal domain-containing protein [Nemania sp. FL0916]|nr:SNF2 family N-terminal domain-containing protein [Nemania sp. FL0916]
MTGTASPASAAPTHHVAHDQDHNHGHNHDNKHTNIDITPLHPPHSPTTSDSATRTSSRQQDDNHGRDAPTASETNGDSASAPAPAPTPTRTVSHNDNPHDQDNNNNNNGDINGDVHDDEPPAKRRRVRDATPDRPIRRPKVESPPWKKVEADGPTTFLEDGKRRSGRTNALPLELQPRSSKRLTRGALNGTQASPNLRDRRAGTATAAASATATAVSNGTQRNASTPRSSTKAAPPAIKPNTRKSLASTPKPSPKTRAATMSSHPPPESPKRSLPTRRSSRTHRDSIDTSPRTSTMAVSPTSSRPTRIRLRVKNPEVPIVHPSQVHVLPGQTIARPKIASTFDEYIARAPLLDIREGGWLDLADEGPPYSQEMAEKDARVILRVEKEVEPGGLLSEGRSSLFAPDPVEEPPRQWAHMDHLVKQMANFRKLMVMEHQRHKATAKKLAEACRDEWLSRQPKTAEEIAAEARSECIARYKTVVKSLAGTWDNVKTEVNRRRLEEWEAAEQKRVKAALNEAVSMSELKLQARRVRADSEALSNEDSEEEDLDPEDSEEEDDGDEMDVDSEEGSSSSIGSAGDEDNMSSSDDDDDVKSTASDEGLTQDQLRQKYADVPDLPDSRPDEDGDRTDANTTEIQANDPGETTDESVDMDDDITSSDEDMNDTEHDDASDDEDDDSDDGDRQGSSLLGLLFGKKELKKLEADAAVEDENLGHVKKVTIEAPEQVADDAGEGVTKLTAAKITEPNDTATSLNSRSISHDQPRIENSIASSKSQPDQAGKATGITTEHSDTLDSCTRPDTANEADSSAFPPRSSQPRDEMDIADTAEHAKQNRLQGQDRSATAQSIAAVTSIEAAHTLSDQQLPSSETDAVTNSLSRDDSQSPRTSDTKPSDVDTAMKLGVSRSLTPSSQSPKTEVPFLLRGTLREYQHYGLDWLADLYKNQTNGILADEMGLGKTIQTIALLAHLAGHHEIWGPHLVIVPTSVMLNWEMEFKKWCPGFKVLSYYGSIEERKRKRQGWKTDDMWNVCITSYQIVLQDQQVFKRRQWHYMILDEAHNIKNFKSKRWQTLLGFNTQARLLLTGTPLQNNLTELWSLLFFLMPSENGVGGFADLAEFQDWFHKPESQILESGREQMDDEARAIIAKLHKVLRPYLLRRLKADVEKQMPAKYEHVELCRLSRRQRELYDGFLARTDTRQALASGNYISVINCLMQLRKVCNHPDLFIERPIMTSFRQPRSIAAEFATTETLIRGKLLTSHAINTASLDFLNLIPRRFEGSSMATCDRVFQLSSDKTLLDLQQMQEARVQAVSTDVGPSTVESSIAYLDSTGRHGRLEELRHCVYINSFRRQQRPIYGKQLTDFLTLGTEQRPFKSRPKIPQKIMSWFEEESPAIRSMVPTLDQRASSMGTIISKFACVTPAVVTRDLDQFVLGSRQITSFETTNLTLSAPIRYAPFMPKEPPLDPWHESRMRLSIQFPDKRLLQYDCGKLQVLDKLLRKLQAGGHRALIFTQMTKVLDVLEQFLNIHGHKYLRLDGATKVEQRQILTDRFNHDPRILCFILSTRSGGLGINLTGADTVIFYDQDWNPAMDKQCQDRCHRIGQTRDVHIYRLVSEHTIEANILRKASQKQMLDDIVIQEGGFTTDYFNKLSVRDVISGTTEEADVVGDAMDRVLGGVESADQRTVGRALEQAEDREDVAAAHVAEKEIQEDEADFAERPPTTPASGASSTRPGTPTTQDGQSIGRSNLGLFSTTADDADDAVVPIENNAWGERMYNIDDYMLSSMGKQLEGTALEFPKDKKKGKSKKGKDTRKR